MPPFFHQRLVLPACRLPETPPQSQGSPLSKEDGSVGLQGTVPHKNTISSDGNTSQNTFIALRNLLGIWGCTESLVQTACLHGEKLKHQTFFSLPVDSASRPAERLRDCPRSSCSHSTLHFRQTARLWQTPYFRVDRKTP